MVLGGLVAQASARAVDDRVRPQLENVKATLDDKADKAKSAEAAQQQPRQQ